MVFDTQEKKTYESLLELEVSILLYFWTATTYLDLGMGWDGIFLFYIILLIVQEFTDRINLS